MSFHRYQISEIYSNADGSIQFIELSVGNFDGESHWQGISLGFDDRIGPYNTLAGVVAAGTPASFVFPHDLPSTSTANTSVLVATQGFADLGLITPDFIIPFDADNPVFLPLDGAKLNFANVDTLRYTSLPGGVLSINHSGTSVANSPRNFAGDSASIPGNPIAGSSGDNNLLGTAAADFMVANAGNDTLDGGAGGDTLKGGPGNDVFVADSSDILEEQPGEGTDTVQTASTAILGENLENLVLGGEADINGTGNELANTITGNAGANDLSGGDGNDTLIGGARNDTLRGGAGIDSLQGGIGADTYFVSSGDTIVESGGGGIDSVVGALSWTLGANLEKLTLSGESNLRGTGNAAGNTLTGNAGNNLLAGLGGADRLAGGAGNDTLRGGSGTDTLVGGDGADRFQFDAALSATGNVDTITDFTHGGDRIRLDDDVFSALSAVTSAALKAAQFYSGAGVVTAHDATDRILYDTDTGRLFYDADGNGTAATAIAFATLAGAPTLTAADFTVIG